MADKLLTDVLGFFVKSPGGNGAADSGKVAMFSAQGGLQATTNTGAAFYTELPVGSTGQGFTAVASNGIAGYFIANGATGLPLLAHSPLAPDLAHFQGPSGGNNLFIENSTMALRWMMAGSNLRLVPHTGSGTLNLPTGSGTLAKASLADGSIGFANITGTAAVNQGGTGRSSFSTINGLVYAGTGTTTPLQSYINGNSGEVLMSGGTNVIPTWAATTGTNTVVRSTAPTITNAILAGTVTASGQVSLTGQQDLVGTSAMTRDLADMRDLINITKFRVCHPGVGPYSARSANGGTSEIGSIWIVNAGTTATAWAKTVISSAVQSFSPFSGQNLDCARNYDMSMVIGSYVQLSGAVRFICGEDAHLSPTMANQPPLAGKGWGFEIRVVGGVPKLRLFAYDAALVYGPDLNWDGGGMHHLILRKNAGTISIYDTTVAGGTSEIPTTPVGTLAGAPTSGGAAGNSIVVTSVNDGTNLAGINYCLLTPDFHIRIY